VRHPEPKAAAQRVIDRIPGHQQWVGCKAPKSDD